MGKYKKTDAAIEARKMKLNGIYQSDLVNSYAWDTAIAFIEKSGHIGYANQKSKDRNRLNTGKSGDKVCNIFDIASNYIEWVTESIKEGTTAYAVERGGTGGTSQYYASARNCVYTSVTNSYCSFKCILFKM